MLSKSSMSFPINSMSSTYNMRNVYRAPTHFLVNAGLSISLHKPKRFDNFIKANVPTPRCLHQPIDGALELAYLVSIVRIDKTFRLHHIQFFLKKAVKECRFDVHLPYIVIVECGNC